MFVAENSYAASRHVPIASKPDIADASGMPSPKLLIGRRSEVGAYYVVTAATQGRQPLFRDGALAQLVITGIIDCSEEGLCSSLAWVVMPDHIHWLLVLERGTLGGCVRRLKSIAARSINEYRSTTGRVWQRGYFEYRLRRDEDVLVQARYIVQNPVRSGLGCRIEDYPYWWCRYIHGTQDLG